MAKMIIGEKIGPVKLIGLTQGMVAIVDVEDYDWLKQYRWSYHNNGYACRVERVGGQQRMILMHREIVGAPDDVYVDHINRKRLDNRRCNLRIATPQQSAYNMSKPKSKTGYRGVTQHSDPKRRKPFQARIRVDGKHLRLGWFETAYEAAQAYDAAARKYHGEYAVLNFPNEEVHGG